MDDKTRYYYVEYSRLLVTGERINLIGKRIPEWELKQLLEDNSKYKYIVKIAKLLEF